MLRPARAVVRATLVAKSLVATRLLAGVTVASATLLTGCGGPPDPGPGLTLTASSPELLDSLRSLTFLMYGAAAQQNSCQEIIDLPVQGLIDRKPQAEQTVLYPKDAEYTYGAIEPAGWRAFVVLGSPEEFAREEPLINLTGHVTAIGCAEVVVEPFERVQLNIQILPAGLR